MTFREYLKLKGRQAVARIRKVRPKPSETDAPQEQGQAQPPAVIPETEIPEPQNEAQATSRPAAQRQWPRWGDERWQTIFTGIIAFATVSTLIFGYLQLRAIRQQTSVMAGQLEIMKGQLKAMNESVDRQTKSIDQTQTLIGQNKEMVGHVQTQADAAVDSAGAAQQSTGIAQKSFTLLERPSMGIEGVSLKSFTVGQIARVDVGLRNSGHIPARNVTVRSTAFFDRAGDVNARCPEPKQGEPIGLSSRTFYAINGVKITQGRSRYPITAKDFDRVIDKKTHWLYVHVVVRYGEGGRYFMEYYSRYNVDTGSWDECETHNNAN